MKILYLMSQALTEKYGATKDEIIQARKNMSADEVEKAKVEILKECNIYSLEDFEGISLYENVNDIAVIPIAGMLVNHVDICAAFFGETVTTYGFIRQAIIDANSDSSIKAILLDHNSGGGYVEECEETFQAILNSEKPVFSVVHDMSASADYWLASASEEIISVSKTSFFGSIGVAAEYVSYKGNDKQRGIERKTFTNSASGKKRPDLLTDDGAQVLIDELDALYNVFAESILIKRNKKLSGEKIDNLEGKVLISSDAIDYGLADKYMQQKDVMPYLQSKIKVNNPESFSGENKPTPVQGKTEGTMSLKELLAANPEAKAEYTAALNAKYAEGVEAGKNEIQTKIKKIAPIMASENYDSALKAQAQKALEGGMSMEAFESVLSMEDMRIEREKSRQAQDDTKATGDTPPTGEVSKIAIENQAAQEELKKIARYA